MKFFRFRKNKKSVIMITAIFSSLLLVPTITQAKGRWAESLVGGIARMILSALTWILTKVMAVLIYVASYNDFIKSAAVSEGWVITRDVANMFFIIILLIIAFATILQIEQYNYKKWLPKLVLMAILINFSKTICGLLIDLGQVIMLTFVNAFLGITAGGFFDMLGMADWKNLSGKDSKISGWTIAAMYVLAVIYALISLIVVIAITFTLIIRMVMLWIYIVLSPLAYLLSAFPGGQKYASQWWGDFTKHLIVGPVLAFFLWLSFASLINLQEISSVSEGFDEYESSVSQGGEIGKPRQLSGYTSEKKGIDTSETMLGFLISIGMLLGGLMISQEIGGAAGKASAVAFGSIKSRADKMTRATYRAPIKATKLAAVGAAGLAVGGLARSERVKDALGAVGSSRFPGVNVLARKTQLSLAKKVKDKKQGYKDFVDTLSPELKERASRNTRGYKREVLNKEMGYYVQGRGKNTKYISAIESLEYEDFKNFTPEKLSTLAKKGIQVNDNPEFANYLSKDHSKVQAYNEELFKQTIETGGSFSAAGFIRTRDKDGNLTNNIGLNDYGIDYDDLLGQSIPEGGVNKNHDISIPYHIENAYQQAKGKDDFYGRPRGKGNLSINSFASGENDIIAADFDVLKLGNIDRMGVRDFRNIKSTNITRPMEIKEIADKLVQVIDQELGTLQAKVDLNIQDPKQAGLTPVEQKRMDTLNQAKQKLSNPQDLQNLSLINSSAANYKPNDVKKTYINESLQNLGIKDERRISDIMKVIIETKNYDALKSPEKLKELLEAQQLRQGSGELVSEQQPSGASATTFTFDDPSVSYTYEYQPSQTKKESVSNIIKKEEEATVKISSSGKDSIQDMPDIQIDDNINKAIKVVDNLVSSLQETGKGMKSILEKNIAKIVKDLKFETDSPMLGSTPARSLTQISKASNLAEQIKLSIKKGNTALAYTIDQIIKKESEGGSKHPASMDILALYLLSEIDKATKEKSDSDDDSK